MATGHRLSSLEIASGLVFGEDPDAPELLEPPRELDSLTALEQALLPALHRHPCLVSFSGGRDSSAVLAVSTRVARREGLPAPVPVTVRFPGVLDTDETQWQELVIRELGLGDWQRLDADGDLGVLGSLAQKTLGRHGLLWPPNVHVLAPLLEAARGGALLTGVGGDELLGGAPSPMRGAVPAALRRAWARQRSPVRLSWLRPGARSSLGAALATEHVREPARWKPRVAWLARRRQLRVLEASGRMLATDAGTQLHHPFLEPAFLSALASCGSRRRYATRTRSMGALFDGVLPEPVLSRTGKAAFTRALWGEEAREFAAGWDGAGVAADLADPVALRRVWSSQRPDFRSATALQAAWLAQSARATLAAAAVEPPNRGG